MFKPLSVFIGLREAQVALTGAAPIPPDVVRFFRVLGSQRPLEIESGGIHQVKPWFAGRLDFAPAVGAAVAFVGAACAAVLIRRRDFVSAPA